MAAAARMTISTEWSDGAAAAALPTEPVPKRRRLKRMTNAKICERIQLGHGTGHGAQYLPWLTLRRKNVSPNSNQVVSWMPPLRRTAHYFSRGEYHTALLLLWLGVDDLREQFPLWPAPHPHPLYGSPLQSNAPLTWAKGLLTIAEEAGIAHGVELGTRVPYVASLDLLATVALPTRIALAAFSSKPIPNAGSAVSWRTRERLELERRYAEDVGSSYFVSHSALIPCLTAGQLETWIDASTLHCAARLAEHVGHFAELLNCNIAAPINEAVADAADALMLPLDDGWFLFRHCCWTQAIDIDPSKRILTSRPVVKGGHRLRDRLREQLFGETWI
jgi:hypothetical protein